MPDKAGQDAANNTPGHENQNLALGYQPETKALSTLPKNDPKAGNDPVNWIAFLIKKIALLPQYTLELSRTYLNASL